METNEKMFKIVKNEFSALCKVIHSLGIDYDTYSDCYCYDGDSKQRLQIKSKNAGGSILQLEFEPNDIGVYKLRDIYLGRGETAYQDCDGYYVNFKVDTEVTFEIFIGGRNNDYANIVIYQNEGPMSGPQLISIWVERPRRESLHSCSNSDEDDNDD